MRKSRTPSPTDGELAIPQVLWHQGPCTVREVHEALRSKQSTGYTTKLKLMQMIREKGLVTRDGSQRSHVYRAAIRKDQTQRRLVRDLIDRVFTGSSMNLVMHALTTKRLSDEELKQVRKLLEEHTREC